MTKRFCYWSVVDGDYRAMMAACIASARAVGVTEDFHVWSVEPVAGAIQHRCGPLNKELFMFKLEYLRREVRRLDYDAYVWLDADNWFVRHPGDVLRVLGNDPVHACLESDVTRRGSKRSDWWGIPLDRFVELMRAKGVRRQSIYNTNAGMWIVRREAVERFCELMVDFWLACEANFWTVTEEAPLAYAAQRLCASPALHTQRLTGDLWASDWTGYFAGRLPDGRDWEYEDFFTDARYPVNPAIVHAMRSKDQLVAWAQRK
jgi:hypothetical protein